MSKRFEALGNYVYEKGERIESAEDLARKLNAYQMRVERFKAEIAELKNQPDPLTAYLYAAELAKDAMKKLKAENAYLKSEVERLQNNCEYLDRELDREIDKTAMLCGEVERLRKSAEINPAQPPHDKTI